MARDGTGQTVVDCSEKQFTFPKSPHTRQNNGMGSRGPGDRVNNEADIWAQYGERLTAAGR